MNIAKTLLLICLTASLPAFAEVVTTEQCHLFESGKLVAKKRCTVTDWQTLGSGFTLEFAIPSYGHFEVSGSRQGIYINDEPALRRVRLKQGYKIAKGVDFTNFSGKKHLECYKERNSGFEICS